MASPTIVLFARGVIALLDLWPALTIAVNEQWGGPESEAKKVWIASSIIDEWEARTTFLPAPQGSTEPPQVDPADSNDPPLDLDDLADFINQMMSDEFEANIEDGSVDNVANNIIRLWHDLLAPPETVDPNSLVAAFEQEAAELVKKGLQASRGADPAEHEGSDDGESGSDDDGQDGMDVDDEAPQLVPRETREKQEPVVDDDGFTLVQKGRKGR